MLCEWRALCSLWPTTLLSLTNSVTTLMSMVSKWEGMSMVSKWEGMRVVKQKKAPLCQLYRIVEFFTFPQRTKPPAYPPMTFGPTFRLTFHLTWLCHSAAILLLRASKECWSDVPSQGTLQVHPLPPRVYPSSCIRYCLFFVCLECQIIRFVISTFTPIFFIEISFVLPPPQSIPWPRTWTPPGTISC